MAYKKWVKENGEEPDLPGMNFTHDQLFFLNYGHVWCSNNRKEDVIQSILSGTHCPKRFRVIGSLQNSEDFAAAFNCKAGSYMNPEKKCFVW